LKYLGLLFLVIFTGCTSTTYSWNMSRVLSTDMIGHVVQNGLVGQSVVPIKHDTLSKKEMGPINSTQYKKMNVTLDSYISSLPSGSTLTIERSKTITSSNIQNIRIEKFGKTLPVDQIFIYQCLGVKNLTLLSHGLSTVEDNTMSKISNPKNKEEQTKAMNAMRDQLKPKVMIMKDQNLCLSYLTAQFKKRSFGDSRIDPSTMFEKNKPSEEPITKFTLNLGQKSHHLYVKNFGNNSFEKKYFSLEANRDDDSRLVLKICSSSLQEKESCVSILPNEYNMWNEFYPLGYAKFTLDQKQIYNIFSLEINAEAISNDSININWARLRHPQYELKINYN